MPEVPREGEVWLVNFEEGGERPAVVVSRNQLNRGRYILVVPCTSAELPNREAYPNYVALPQGAAGLPRDCLAQAHLIQPVDPSILMRRLGTLDSELLSEILRAIAWVIDFFDTAGVEPL